MNWGFWIRRAAALVVVGLVLAGCSDGDGGAGTVSPDVSASAVSTPTVSATPPALPSAEATPASAVAFVRYFWDAYNYAYATYDTTPLNSVSKPSCTSCSALVTDVQDMKTSRTKISGYGLSVIEVASPPVKISSGTLVESTLRQLPGQAVRPDGKVSKLAGFKSVRSTVALAWNGTTWRIEAVTNDPKSRKPWPA